MLTDLKKNILDIFNGYYVKEKDETFKDNEKENLKFIKKCLQYAIIPSPDFLHHKNREEILHDIKIYYGINRDWENTTFYGTFKKVTETDEFDLFILQILHYFTRYGLDLNDEEIFRPYKKRRSLKELIDVFQVNKKYLKRIDVIDKKDVIRKMQNFFYNTTSVSKLQIDKIKYIIDDLQINFNKIEIERVKNKELKIFLIDLKNKITNSEEWLRYAIYKLTKTTLIINSKQLKYQMKIANFDTKIFKILSKSLIKFDDKILPYYKQKRKLMEIVFYKLWKFNDKKTNQKITYIRKNFKRGITLGNKLTDILENGITFDKLKLLPVNFFLQNFTRLFSIISDRNNFIELSKYFDWLIENKKIDYLYIIKVLNAIRIEKMLCDNVNQDYKVYQVRNGKTFVQNIDIEKYDCDRNSILILIEKLLENILVKTIKLNYKKSFDTITIDKTIENFKMPLSLKKVIYPYFPPEGSYITLPKNLHNVISAINWTTNSGCVDLDLSATAFKNEKEKIIISWNSGFKNKNNSIIHTGDETCSGTEAILINKDKIKYRFLKLQVRNYSNGGFTKEKNFVLTIDDKNINYIKRNKIKMLNFQNSFIKFPLDFKDSNVIDLGTIDFKKNRYIFPKLVNDKSIVEYAREIDIQKHTWNVILSNVLFSIKDFFEILQLAGKLKNFEIVNSNKATLTYQNWNTVDFIETYLK